jgi:hypothetical protein
MDPVFAMTDEEYAELLEYEVVTEEAPQYYIDPRRLCDYLDLTNVNLDNIDEPEWPVEGKVVVASVEQEDDHDSVRASSVRIKSEPLSEEGITAARTGSVKVKEELSEDGFGEVEWVDVLPPMAKTPEIKQESNSEDEAEYIPTPPRVATPWTIPEGGFVYYPPSPAATEPMGEPLEDAMEECEDEEETVFDKAAKDLQYRILHIDEDHPAVEDDIDMPDAEEEVVEVKEVEKIQHFEEMEGLEETADEKTAMDCTTDVMPIDRALLHPDTAAKLKSARCRRSPGCRRTPSNGSLSSTGSSSSRRSPKRAERQKTDVFRETLHKIHEFSVDRVAVQPSQFG